MRLSLSGITTTTRRRADGSKVYYRYHRASRTKLIGEPGSPEFLASYAMGRKAKEQHQHGELSGLIDRFLSSGEFSDLAETTQCEYHRKLGIIGRRWGSYKLVALAEIDFRREFLKWRDEIALRARAESDNIASCFSRVLRFAVDRAEIDHNVLSNIRRLRRPSRADRLWFPEHVADFTEACRMHQCTSMYIALMLGLHTGQRQGDLRRLPWSGYDGERITLRQGKSGRYVSIRCTKPLLDLLDAAGQDKKGVLILTTATGLAFTKRYFNTCWDRIGALAGISDLHFHDLRGTAVTMLAEAGCTVPEIAAVTGHSLKHADHILETYLSRTRQLADAAILKLDERRERMEQAK